MPKVKKVNAFDPNENSLLGAIDFGDEVSRTQQSQAVDADINTIVKRFKVTGVLPQGVRVPTYGDFDGVSDFREAMEAIMVAEDSFSRMSADVRRRFDNDPGKFVAFCSDPANVDEMRKMGLAVPAKPDALAESAADPKAASTA